MVENQITKIDSFGVLATSRMSYLSKDRDYDHELANNSVSYDGFMETHHSNQRKFHMDMH